MKGKVTIELHDAKTGELVRRAEQHNLVTNALKYIMNCESSCGHVLEDDVFPIATRGLGGILLFDGKLTEDANNVYMPGTGSHLIGYANGDTNAADIHRGSYNSAESGPTPTGYKSVWDFGTSQCNGTIAAVARTSFYSGRCPYVYYMGISGDTCRSGNPSSDAYWYPIRYDGEYVYMAKFNENTMRIYRVRRAMMTHKVADYSGRVEDYEKVAEIDTTIFKFTTTDSSGKSTDHTWWVDNQHLFMDGHDGYIYVIYAGYGGEKTGYTFAWYTLNYGDGSWTKSDTQTFDFSDQVYCSNSSYSHYENNKWTTRYVSYFDDSRMVRISNKHVYAVSSDMKRILQVNLDNVADQSDIRIIDSSSSDWIYNLQQISPYNGGVYFTVYHYTTNGYEFRNGILYEDGTYILNDFDGTNNMDNWYYGCDAIGDHLERFGEYSDISIRRGFMSNYLGTIANLSTAITKNASQTMKLTYTLTDEEATS